MAKTRSEINYNFSKKAYDDVRLQVPKGQKAAIKSHADAMNESINAFIRRAINETIARDRENAVYDSVEI